MAVAKKYKIFKICKELNLGHDTIIGFLEKKSIKVSGPNASVPEEVYIEILEKFAQDKAKAEALKARRAREEGREEAVEVVDESKAEDGKPSYLDVLKKSIEEDAEAISKGEKEPRSKRHVRKTQPVTLKAEAEAAELPADQEIPARKHEGAKPAAEQETAEPVSVKKEAAQEIGAKEIPGEEKKGVVKKEVPAAERERPRPEAERKEKPAPVKPQEKKRPQDEEEKKTDKKKKFKGKKKTTREEEAGLSEKEKKRRKALEMIRKEKGGRKRGKKVDLRHIGDEGEEVPAKSTGRKRKKKKKTQIDMKEVQETLKKTLASMDSKGRKPKRKKVKEDNVEESDEKIIRVAEFISANELSNIMDVPVSEIIMKCLELGLVVTINQRLDIDTITLIAEEYGYKVEEQYATEFVSEEEEEEEMDDENLVPRAPIVTIMGHVDHGKTSLLDYLRKSNIVGGEAGGITQHIGAYEVVIDGKSITFLDTPGHEAFTAMRARGAQVTDIVILVIAADDAVMPQTDEAIDHAKAAGVHMVIAINKIDKPGANPERIKQQLAERNILVEDWGGTYQCAEISAKTGQGIPELLEKVLLEAEMLDLKANPTRRAVGVVIEAKLDKGKGPIATVLIQDGTLRVGDHFVAGHHYGRVRALLNERGEKIESLGPSKPAVVLGFEGIPQAGDRFVVMKDEKAARELSLKRQQLRREQEVKQVKMMTLQQISERIAHGEIHDLPVIIKADVDGSAEAISDALINLNTDEVKINVVRKAVGPITESDVLLASASGAVIIGFNVRANIKAKELAEKEVVDIRTYKVIYDAIDDIKMAMEGMLKPTFDENILGRAEVRDTFKISRIGTIAGCYVLSGKIPRNAKIRVVRDDVEVYSGKIASLKRFKEDVREVASGFECGIQIENFNDLKVGDIIEAYELIEVKRKLV
ncbi:MAG: translation initiation factor IF-2 [Calditrichaeota bacterium]|nr:translation initiation factor IF-2 [Calditrichota bacterium]